MAAQGRIGVSKRGWRQLDGDVLKEICRNRRMLGIAKRDVMRYIGMKI